MKPDWKDAPAWAAWLAMDSDESWFWYETKPTFSEGEWISSGRSLVVTDRGAGGSLEERPIDPPADTAKASSSAPDVESAAMQIYEAMRFGREDSTPAWVAAGNSLAQDIARRTARALLATPPASAQQPSAPAAGEGVGE